MKSVRTLLIFACTLVALAPGAYAQSPREQLNQMVQQLQKTPNDDGLREKIIKFARELKPKPTIPDEAQRRMARGTAAFKDAKTATDYQDAAREFEQATLAAPWYGDAYYNLGVAQDKAEQYETALRSLKLARLASPDAKDIKDFVYQVEYRNEKASSPAAQEARRRAEEQRFLASLDGAIFDCEEHKDERWHVKRWSQLKGGQLQHWQHVLWAAEGRGFSHLPLTPTQIGAPESVTGKTTQLGSRTFILEQDKLTSIAHDGPFAGRRFVCNKR
jgi:tetratricopeptide (TPR) repeat protein